MSGNETTLKTRTLERPGNPALGRGIEEIEADAWENLPIAVNIRTVAKESEEEQAGEAIPAIIRILAALPESQCANVFSAVQAIRQTARRSSNEITRIGDELTRIERDKAKREAAPKKKWWRLFR